MLSVLTQIRHPKMVPLVRHVLESQTVKEWEWLLFGEGQPFSSYDEAIIAARGKIIIHMDEQAYYAPTYLQQALYHLKDDASCIIGAWFGYDLQEKRGLYWSAFEPNWTKSNLDYSLLRQVSGLHIREIDYDLTLSSEMASFSDFTFCYQPGIEGSQKILADQWGSVVRLIEEPTVLAKAPYFRLPPFMFERHLPRFLEYLEMRDQWLR